MLIYRYSCTTFSYLRPNWQYGVASRLLWPMGNLPLGHVPESVLCRSLLYAASALLQ